MTESVILSTTPNCLWSKNLNRDEKCGRAQSFIMAKVEFSMRKFAVKGGTCTSWKGPLWAWPHQIQCKVCPCLKEGRWVWGLSGDSKVVSLRQGYVLPIWGYGAKQNDWHSVVFVLVIYCSITYYFKTWGLTATHIYYFIASLVQESGHGLAMCLWIMVSHRATITQLLGLQSSEGSAGEESAFKSTQCLLAGSSSLWAVELGISVPCQLLSGHCPQFLATWAPPTWQLHHQSGQERGPDRENTKKMEVTVLYYLISEVLSCHFCKSQWEDISHRC